MESPKFGFSRRGIVKNYDCQQSIEKVPIEGPRNQNACKPNPASNWRQQVFLCAQNMSYESLQPRLWVVKIMKNTGVNKRNDKQGELRLNKYEISRHGWFRIQNTTMLKAHPAPLSKALAPVEAAKIEIQWSAARAVLKVVQTAAKKSWGRTSLPSV
ncbi:hypothetical protein [Salinisphaera sp. T31B1]|uniref:hypothetical protein n=1 Tax=Salinisphaera sp. T31B1 TaxID=727963 RepID=UPI00333F2F9A